MFATPVAYSASLVPAKWRGVYGLNPMTGVVNGFRWSLLGSTSSGSALMMAISITVVLLLLVSGLIYFRRMERCFADLV
jgi:lipopolysaccharide transport system permease protein